MSQGDLHGIRVWGRPFKPVAFGLSLSMAFLVIVNVTNTGRLGSNVIGDVVAVVAGGALICLVAGWIARSQVMAEWGLLLSAATMVMRGAFLALTVWPDQSMLFSVASATIAGGAYLLERLDPDRLR